jgi:hypothetical protein
MEKENPQLSLKVLKILLSKKVKWFNCQA